MSDESITFLPSPLPQSGQYKAIRGIFCFAYTLVLLALPLYICGEASKKGCQGQYRVAGPNVSTTPLRQWGFRQCLPFSWITLRDKHCRHPIAVLGVVDTFGPVQLSGHFSQKQAKTEVVKIKNSEFSYWA